MNESLGAQTGDDFLKRVSVILQTNCRSSDFVARIDGDRFGILLADAHPRELTDRVDSLDRMVRAASRETNGEERVGISAGVACYPEYSGDAAGLLAQAEREMARVKRERSATGSVLQLVRSLEKEGTPATVESR
jgi:diguanylate cyclase (GGDEF)-like protein